LVQEQESGVGVKAAFRVMGPDLDPAAVSQLLDLEPTEAHRRGDPRVGKSGRRYSDFSEGLWGWRPDLAESEPLAEHLRALLDVLEPKAMGLQQLKEIGLRLDLFVGVFGSEGNFALILEQELLSRLGRLGVDLVLDVYSC
jgi:hypothetical protein